MMTYVKRLSILAAATLGIFSLVLMTSPNVWSGDWEIDHAHSSVGFKIRHIVSKTRGTFDQFQGKFTYVQGKPGLWKVDATIQTASINTNNKKRDKHLRSADFLDVKKFPKMTFKSTRTTASGKNKAKMTGNLTLHGVTKPVTLDIEVHGQAKDPWGNQRIGATARTKIDRKDFGMSWNKTMAAGGLLLGNEVEILLEIEGIAKDPKVAPGAKPKKVSKK